LNFVGALDAGGSWADDCFKENRVWRCHAIQHTAG
jgi:hypothetical protein